MTDPLLPDLACHHYALELCPSNRYSMQICVNPSNLTEEIPKSWNGQKVHGADDSAFGPSRVLMAPNKFARKSSQNIPKAHYQAESKLLLLKRRPLQKGFGWRHLLG